MDGKGKPQGLKSDSGTELNRVKESKEECLSECREVKDATGCEFHEGRGSTGICVAHTQEVKSGDGQDDFLCFVF